MTHQPMADFKKSFTNIDPINPTGWGRLQHEPTTSDRHSNAWWDETKYEDSKDREDYTYINDYGEEVEGRRLTNKEERRFYDARQHTIDEYDTAAHWQKNS